MSNLTPEQLNTLEGYANTGDRTAYWSNLAKYQNQQGQDNRYAMLALGVAQDNTAAGQLANAYMRYIAQQEGTILTPQIEYEIGVSLMQADFILRNIRSGADIILNDVRNYHINAFGERELPPETWTAYPILEALGDSVWDQLLNSDSVDDWLYTSTLNDGLVTGQMIISAAIGHKDAQGWVDAMINNGVLATAFGEQNPVLGTVGPNGNVAGTSSNDILLGSDGDNILHGFEGDDILSGGAGIDWLHGGADFDTADYSAHAYGLTVDARLLSNITNREIEFWTITDSNGTADSLTAIEKITGSQLGDYFFGNLNGLHMDGGGGIDTIDYSHLNTAINLDTSFGVNGGVDIIAGFEHIIGTNFSDRITGGPERNILIGGQGSDTLTGGDGDDVFVGTLDQHNGDTITDLQVGDSIFFSDVRFDDSAVTIDANGIVISADGKTSHITTDIPNGATLLIYDGLYLDGRDGTWITIGNPTVTTAPSQVFASATIQSSSPRTPIDSNESTWDENFSTPSDVVSASGGGSFASSSYNYMTGAISTEVSRPAGEWGNDEPHRSIAEVTISDTLHFENPNVVNGETWSISTTYTLDANGTYFLWQDLGSITFGSFEAKITAAHSEYPDEPTLHFPIIYEKNQQGITQPHLSGGTYSFTYEFNTQAAEINVDLKLSSSTGVSAEKSWSISSNAAIDVHLPDDVVMTSSSGYFLTDAYAAENIVYEDLLLPQILTLSEQSIDGYGGILTGEDGNTRLIGSTGDDSLSDFDGNNELKGKDGNDIMRSGNGNDVHDGGLGDDNIQSNGGNDYIAAGAGNDIVDSGSGEDIVYSGTGSYDLITLGTGADQLIGNLTELFGDRVTDFSEDDAIIISDTTLSRSQINVQSSFPVLSFDENIDGIAEGAITLEGNFSEGDFMAITDNGNTTGTFESFLPELREQQAVDPSQVNGIINQHFLKGDGSTNFKVTLRDMGHAGYNNAVGVYEIDEVGNILDPRILFQNANEDKAAEVIIKDVEDGNYLGFFIVQNAASTVATWKEDDTLSFVNSDGENATLSDLSDIFATINGEAVDEFIFHSFNEDMNFDDVQHALSGVEEGGEAITIGFEDLTGGGDRDYEDVVFQVEHIVDEFIF